MKNKISLFDTEFAKLNGLDHGSNTTVKYLIDNRRIILTDSERKAIYDTKGLASTAASAIVNGLASEGLLDMFTLVDTSLSSQSLPELLAISEFTVDMKQMPGSTNVMNSIKEYKNRIVFNTAPIIKRTREGYVTLTNLNDFHLMITRGALVNSYYTANGSYWLNPNLLKFITRSYSSILAVPIVRHFRLSIPEQLLIETILSYFIMSRMADNYIELLLQCDFLGSKITIKNTIDSIEDRLGKDSVMSLSSMCDLMVACGPEHMSKFNVDIFKRMCGSMGSSSISTNIALEYPPYWVYQLIYTLSDNKTYLGVLLQQTRLLKPAEQFLQTLISSRQFIPALKTQGIGLESLDIVNESSSLFEGYNSGKESFLSGSKLNDSLLVEGTEGIGLLLLGALAVTLGVSYIYDKIDNNKRAELIKKLQPFMAEFDSKLQKAYANYKRAYTNISKVSKKFLTIDKHLVRTDIDTDRGPLESPEEFVKSIVNTVSWIIHNNLKQAVVGDKIYVTIDSPLQIIYDYEKVWESPDEIYTDPDTNKEIDAYRLEATIIKKIRDIGKSISSTDVIYDVSDVGDHTGTSFKINTYITTGDIDKLVAQIKSSGKKQASENLQSDIVAGEEGVLTGVALAAIIGGAIYSWLFGGSKDNLTKDAEKKIKDKLAPLASKMRDSYIDYVKTYKLSKNIESDLNAKQISYTSVGQSMSDIREFMDEIHGIFISAIKNDLKNPILNGNMFMFPDCEYRYELNGNYTESDVVAICNKYSSHLTKYELFVPNNSRNNNNAIGIRPSTGIDKSIASSLLEEMKKLREASVPQGDKVEDPEYGTMIKTRQGLAPNKLVPLTNINGKTTECKIIFVDYDSKGITDKHRKTLAFLLKNKSFIKNKFNMKTFESYIDDFDIDTPVSEVVKDMMFSKLYIYPNGAFYVDVTLPHDNQYSGLDIIFYVDKSLKSMGVDYGEGGGSYLDIGEENLRNNPFALRRPIIDDKTDGADTTRTSDGVLIMDPTVGRLQYAHGVLRTLGEVEIPTFRGVITRKHINYEIVDENEPTLTVEQVYATQRMVKFGGVFQHTQISDNGIYTLEDINVSAAGISTFSVSVLVDNNTTRYFECVNNPGSDKLDSILEVSDSLKLPIQSEEYAAIERYYSDDLSGILGVGYEADGDSIGSYVKKIFNWIVEKITMLYNKVVEFLMKVKNFFSPSKIKEDIEEVKNNLSPDNEKDVKAILDEINDHINNAKTKSVDPELVLGLVACLNEFNQSVTYEDTQTNSSEHKDNVVQTWYNKSNQKYKNEFVEITKTERVKSFEKETTLSELLKRIIPSFDGFNVENLYTVYEDVYTSLTDATEKLKKEQTDIIHTMRNLANTSSRQMMGRSTGVIKTINSIASQLLATAQLRIRNEVFLYNDTLKKIHMSLKKILDTVSDNKVVTVTMEDVTEMDHTISALPAVMEMDGYKVYKFADYKKVFDKFHFVLFGPGKLDNISDTQVNAFAVSSNNASNDHIVITNAAARSPEWVRNGIVAHEIGHIVKGHNIVNLEKIAGTPDKRVDSNSLVTRAILGDMYRSPKHEIEADMYCYKKYGKETTIKMLKFIAPGYAGKILDYLSRMIARFLKRRSDTVKMAIPFLPRENDLFTRIKYFENKTD